MRISNGYLPPEVLTTAEALACQQAVAREVSKLIAGKLRLLHLCLDRILAHEVLGKPVKPALKACAIDAGDSKSLVGRLAAARAKAVSLIAKKCGPLSPASTRYTESNIHTHLGMASSPSTTRSPSGWCASTRYSASGESASTARSPPAW